MVDDVKLLLPAVETVFVKKDEVHKGKPLRDEVSADLSIVKADIQEVKEQLFVVQVVVQTNAEAISALTSKADEANAQLAKHGKLLQQILELLQRPVVAPTPSFTATDRIQLDQTLDGGLLQARSLIALEQRMNILALTLDNIFSSHGDDEEGEIDLDVLAAAITTTETEADAPRAEANEVEVVDETIRANVEARDKDLPVTPTTDAGEKEDDDEDDDNEDDDDFSTHPDAAKDLGGDYDEDDDDDDFTIQYQKPASALKGVCLRDSASQGVKQKEKDMETSEKN
ncbi:uncharacterized protein LOC112503600 [Cynara cardunculus var. scolymus]|uniref:uncharacterized protein LOC112503600 n=1 Tax=Cynara cardunculus var. scolymus TaxID=59895 RepID=UPI000D626C0D|nr:uncharacterized protein LOC112503600 [Cynara cardunculus var. scolymus]